MSTKKVGKYYVKARIGRGAFAEVRFAVHEDTGEEFAVKIFDRSGMSKPDVEEAVKREIRIMQYLRHPNIVGIEAVVMSSKNLYMFMELVRGGELYDEIVSKHHIDEKTSRFYFQQIVDAMVYCHRRGVVHRDLKPENLLLDEKGNIKITDFGMSWMKETIDPEAKAKQLLRTQCGTPKYMAPEVIVRPDKGYDGEKLDAWECGIVLYALLAGYLPFFGDDDDQVFRTILKGQLNFPSHFSPGVRDVLSKLLQKNPEERFSLEEIRRHSWFLVDYHGDAVENRRQKLRNARPELLATAIRRKFNKGDLSSTDPSQEYGGPSTVVGPDDDVDAILQQKLDISAKGNIDLDPSSCSSLKKKPDNRSLLKSRHGNGANEHHAAQNISRKSGKNLRVTLDPNFKEMNESTSHPSRRRRDAQDRSHSSSHSRSRSRSGSRSNLRSRSRSRSRLSRKLLDGKLQLKTPKESEKTDLQVQPKPKNKPKIPGTLRKIPDDSFCEVLEECVSPRVCGGHSFLSLDADTPSSTVNCTNNDPDTSAAFGVESNTLPDAASARMMLDNLRPLPTHPPPLSPEKLDISSLESVSREPTSTSHWLSSPEQKQQEQVLQTIVNTENSCEIDNVKEVTKMMEKTQVDDRGKEAGNSSRRRGRSVHFGPPSFAKNEIIPEIQEKTSPSFKMLFSPVREKLKSVWNNGDEDTSVTERDKRSSAWFKDSPTAVEDCASPSFGDSSPQDCGVPDGRMALKEDHGEWNEPYSGSYSFLSFSLRKAGIWLAKKE